MGIPSYFSYIVKTHSEIIKRYYKNDMTINNFFMDCNSIIYDVVNTHPDGITDAEIIAFVITKIEEYIAIISPTHVVFIAFDGVAPVAKMEQQRCRRYKSNYQKEYAAAIHKKDRSWDTSAITPGTAFMQHLNDAVNEHFKSSGGASGGGGGGPEVIVSMSDEAGEGEHKLFEYIRTSPKITKESTNVIYGLDSDLIMLAMNHLPVNENIYLFRETPEFIKSINRDLVPHADYMLDIPLLSQTIASLMSSDLKTNRVYDYILLCFFLGNDFMPHFPALNIRTGGIDKMINAYRETIGKTSEVLTDGSTIYWKNIFLLVSFLAKLEEEFIKKEMKLRDRKERYTYPEDTPEQIMKKFEVIPTYDRSAEHFINPFSEGWQKRYYLALFQCKINSELREKICNNYLEGIEWTLKYYTSGCPDYHWRYHYNYPPLLCDLVRHIPKPGHVFIGEERKANQPVSPLEQLCYVLPRKSLGLLPIEVRAKLDPTLYPIECTFTWAFCQYFWESHPELPEITF